MVEYTDCTYTGGKRLSNEYPEYDTKQSDGEAPALKILAIWSTPLLALFPGPLWPEMVVPDRVLLMGQIKQTVFKQMIDVKL